tara:strand:- start:533 stop:1771 length:1239 start_codon:yes stop_codon:yes gene_type:complete
MTSARALQTLTDTIPALDDSDVKVRLVAIGKLDDMARFGWLEPHVIAKYAQHIVPRLNDTRCSVRNKAVNSLGKLGKRVIVEYADDISQLLTDRVGTVRGSALEVFGKCVGDLEPRVRAKYATNIAPRLSDTHWSVRNDAVKALRRLGRLVIVDYADDISQLLTDKVSTVRGSALEALGELEPCVFAKYAPLFVTMLDDGEHSLRVQALGVVGSLDPGVLTKYADQIIPLILCSDYIMHGGFKSRLIWKLEPRVFKKYAEDIVGGLGSADNWGCAHEALERLEPLVVARYAGEIVPYLDRESSPCHMQAMRALDKVPLMALVPHRYALQSLENTREPFFICIKDRISSLRGRVWLVRWRQLFWCKRFLWWWWGCVWTPGSRQARAVAIEFGRMQGVSAEEEGEQEVKRARAV